MSGHQDASGPHAGQPVLHAGKPLGAAPVVVILVHGRGAGPENILDLVPALGVADVTYLAPAAANRTWYPYGFMSDIAKNEPYLSSALSVLESLVARVEASGAARDHVVIGGFSQGACLTTEFAIRNAARFGGVVAFSGGAIGPPGTTWAAEGTESAESGRRRHRKRRIPQGRRRHRKRRIPQGRRRHRKRRIPQGRRRHRKRRIPQGRRRHRKRRQPLSEFQWDADFFWVQRRRSAYSRTTGAGERRGLRANGRRRDHADLSGDGPPRQRRRNRLVAVVTGRPDLKETLNA